jgi:hypothetical protein
MVPATKSVTTNSHNHDEMHRVQDAKEATDEATSLNTALSALDQFVLLTDDSPISVLSS